MNKENNEHKTIINENKIETKAGNLKQLISECFTGSHRNELFARIVWISDAAPDLPANIETKFACHCKYCTYVSNILSVSSVTGNCAHPKIRTVCVTDACDARRPIFVFVPYDLFTKGPLQRNVWRLTFVYILYDLCLVSASRGLCKILSG